MSDIIQRFKNWYDGLDEEDQTEILKHVLDNRPRPNEKLSQIVGFENTGSKFDLDLFCGQVAENELETLLQTVEVKTDSKAAQTGNLAVEYFCRGRPSGIETTKAKHWAFILNGAHKKEIIIIIETDRLKRLVRGCRSVSGGDNNVARMYLLPISDVFKS